MYYSIHMPRDMCLSFFNSIFESPISGTCVQNLKMSANYILKLKIIHLKNMLAQNLGSPIHLYCRVNFYKEQS